MKRTRVQNFAAQNAKTKSRLPAVGKANAESLRDMFVRMIVVVSEKTSLDLRKIISYPITTYPLSLAHCDGAHMKTEKSPLLRKLESLQTETITDAQLPRSYVQVYDGGLLHSVLSQTATGASYALMARTMLSVLCSGRASEVHVCMDKYMENSIKDSERKSRGAVDTDYVITGPEQKIRQSGKKLLTNGVFKNEFAKFLLKEWKKANYWNIFGGKTLIGSYGGECLQYVPDKNNEITVTRPLHLQGDHEEADRYPDCVPHCKYYGRTCHSESIQHRCLGNTYWCYWPGKPRRQDDGQHYHGLWNGKQLKVHQCNQHC